MRDLSCYLSSFSVHAFAVALITTAGVIEAPNFAVTSGGVSINGSTADVSVDTRSDFQETLESLVESCFVADYTPAGHGMGAGTIVLIIILVLGGIACLGGCFVYRKKLDLDSVKGMMGKVGGRSRTSPGSTVSLGNPPLTSPMRAQDSAAENFNTAYTPPINSSTL